MAYPRVVLSIGKIAAGTGWEYLAKDLRYAIGEYYIGTCDTAPTRWLGSGLGLLGLGGVVTVEEMKQLFGLMVDPRDGSPLGRVAINPRPSDDPVVREAEMVAKIAAAVQRREQQLDRVLVAEEVAEIDRTIRSRRRRVGVGRVGFDVLATEECVVVVRRPRRPPPRPSPSSDG